MSRDGFFIDDPARGLVGSKAFHQNCHVESRERVNTFLHMFATTDPDDHKRLKRVAVNPFGERKSPNDYLNFWHPEMEAIRLKDILNDMQLGGSFEHEVAEEINKAFDALDKSRTVSRSLVRKQQIRYHQEKSIQRKEEAKKEG